MIMAFFCNPWTIGIVGGIISGILVFFITRAMFSKKEKKEYFQRLTTANNEMLYAIRPIIVENKIPTAYVLSAIRSATAKKYEVKIEELYSNEEIAADLTKEIMDTPFLTSESKLKYSEIVNNFRLLSDLSAYKIQYVERTNMFSSFSISMALALTSMLAVFLSVFAWEKDIFSFDLGNGVWGISLIPPLVMFVSLFLGRNLELRRTAKELRRTAKESDKIEIRERGGVERPSQSPRP